MNKTESVGNVDEESITYIDNTAQLAYHYEETDKPYKLALCMKDSNVEPVWWSLANIFDSDDYISSSRFEPTTFRQCSVLKVYSLNYFRMDCRTTNKAMKG